MGIVAAGVHDAHVLRLIDRFVGLGDGQSVDIRTENDHTVAGQIAFQLCIHARLAAAFVRDAKLIQLLFDSLRRPELMQADFRMGVKLTPHRNDVFFPCFCLFCD